jgi:hypothetical protein
MYNESADVSRQRQIRGAILRFSLEAKQILESAEQKP